MTDLTMRVDDLSDPRIAEFLADHLRDMHAKSPPESVHALDLAALKQPDITFWSGWHNEALVGCGALKRLDAGHVELKSMRTSPLHRRKGIGAFILRFILSEARQRGYRRMSLETGSMSYFTPAHRLYAAHGFLPCPPFEGYGEDPNSVFMTLLLGDDPVLR